MKNHLILVVSYLAISLIGIEPSRAAESGAAPAAPAAPKPPLVKLRHEGAKISYRVTIRPGVPEPGQTAEVEIELAQILETPDPTFGSRKPIADADIKALLVSSDAQGKRRRRASKPWVEARKATPLRDAGTYGFTFTAPKRGVYGLHFYGKTDVGDIDYEAVIPFGVWPLPEGVGYDNPPPMPKKIPEALPGDLAHGKALCAARCRTDVEGAFPKGETPTFLRGDLGAGLTDDGLLKTMLKDGGPRLTILERNDLLYHLHSLYPSVADFFPEAAVYVAEEFTLNEHAKKRLKETLNVALSAEETKAMVFVAYQGESRGHGPVLIGYEDRVARNRLHRNDKIGYLVFLRLPKEPRARELAIAMDKNYEIRGLVARDIKGRRDSSLNRKLKSFVGLGRFNDARSLKKGSAAWRKALLPVYLEAAEFATMYYGAEREFTEFDAEFGDEEDVSAQGGELKVKVKH